MPKIITQIKHSPRLAQKKKVAAYARVSSGKDAMLHSLSAQVSYYSALIQKETDWEYVGVYSDEAITGTKEDRPGLQQLIADCQDGKINMVITKSISRFARNTVTLLELVRMLQALGVDIYFEEQNIHTMSSDGELLLTILASYAQEESRSVSENMKWRIKKNFEAGIPWNGRLLGYRLGDDHYEIVPEEAVIVRRIFSEYLEGAGTNLIAQRLNEDGIATSRGGELWHKSSIAKILGNYTYTGNLILQRTFRDNHISKKSCINEGQLPRYHAENSHEAIIDVDTFMAVQMEIERREKPKRTAPQKYPYTGLIVCAKCGKNYRRKTTATGPVWICATFNTRGKKYCASKQIPESTLEATVHSVTADLMEISKILVADGNTLLFQMSNGTEITRTWTDRSRSESWTDEMRQQVSNRQKRRYNE